MNDFSWVLNLEKEKVPGLSNIKRIPDLEEMDTKKFGLLYVVKYFVNDGKHMRMIRFTSKDKSFKTLVSFDICDNRLEPSAIKVVFKPNQKDTFLKFIGMAVMLINKKALKESIILNESFSDSLRQLLAAFFPYLVIGGIILYGVIWAWVHERKMNKLETDTNEALFSKQKEDEPAYAIYFKTTAFVKNVMDGPFSGLILCGPPGTSKTYIVRRTLFFLGKKSGQDYNVSKGATASLTDVYYMLWKNRDKILILDDFDSPLKNDDMINFLKSITDTYKNRIVNMPRERTISLSDPEVTNVPQRFNFEGKIVIITNLRKKQIDRALLSRCPCLEIEFSPKEVFDGINKMMDFMSPSVSKDVKMEVLNYIMQLYNKNKNIDVNFRAFQNSVDARVGLPAYWKEMVDTIVGFN